MESELLRLNARKQVLLLPADDDAGLQQTLQLAALKQHEVHQLASRVREAELRTEELEALAAEVAAEAAEMQESLATKQQQEGRLSSMLSAAQQERDAAVADAAMAEARAAALSFEERQLQGSVALLRVQVRLDAGELQHRKVHVTEDRVLLQELQRQLRGEKRQQH
jgi:chromosome segregation ATPase